MREYIYLLYLLFLTCVVDNVGLEYVQTWTSVLYYMYFSLYILHR
jgi:hypothetical protein